MTPGVREKLIACLVSIVKAPMDERVRADRLASNCFMYHLMEGDSSMGTPDSTWVKEIWPQVMQRTGCRTWAEIIEDSKTMQSMEKH